MYLDIGFVSQLNFGAGNNMNDPTGCWYASASMIGFAYEAGPRLGIPQLYSRPITHADGSSGTGHWAMELGWVDTLMKNENLVKLDGGLPDKPVLIATALKKWGPLMLSWWKTNQNGASYGHASVLIGIEKDIVILHDPENAPRSRIPLSDFYPRYQKMAGAGQIWWPVLRRNAPAFSYTGKVVG
ncbi:papain-like cysteine protease family protein [Methylomonas sp. AM2-LC]|uniref:papain-like cysteine protease family protein n=1 Tax=Methylomonas sp. AM2-LC TaxID=3153301 RepID=UPI00326556A1